AGRISTTQLANGGPFGTAFPPTWQPRFGGALLFPPPVLTERTAEVEATSILPLVEREDCTPTAWYPSLYAPRTGGAYDSHHRTAGIAGCTRRRGGRMAARGARAAADDAGDRISPHCFT